MQFYEITPFDTVFFRGSEPLIAGQLIVNGLFPPPVTVIEGAIRTAVLKQNGIAFSSYNNGNGGEQIEKLIGKSVDESPPFNITAILLKKGNDIFAPTPYSWHIDFDKKIDSGRDVAGLEVTAVKCVANAVLEQLAVKTSSNPLPIVSLKNAVSLGSNWIRLSLLQKTLPLKLSEGDLKTAAELYAIEARTGISRLDENNRSTQKTKKGALFTAGHIRLKNDVTILVAVDRECGLQPQGTIVLGGERRTSAYSKLKENPPLTLSDKSEAFVSLSPIKMNQESLSACICTGKAVVTAGWSMHNKFHKETCSWLPAGSVFNRNINNQCASLA